MHRKTINNMDMFVKLSAILICFPTFILQEPSVSVAELPALPGRGRVLTDTAVQVPGPGGHTDGEGPGREGHQHTV